MGSAFHQLCLRYNGTLTPTAPTTIRLWETFTFFNHVKWMLADLRITQDAFVEFDLGLVLQSIISLIKLLIESS